MINNIRHNQRGAALLLALLMMSGLVVVGVVLGDLTISELRQSRNLDQSMVAYYGAESGAERAIYEWRQSGSDSGFTSIDCLNEDTLSSVGWTCESAPATLNEISFTLPEFIVKEIPLYLPTQLNVNSGVESATVDWQSADPTTNLEYPWLEVTLLSWDASDAQVNFASDAHVTKRLFPCSPAAVGGVVCDQAVINDFVASNSYVVRLRALHNDVSNVTIKFYDGGANPVDIGTYLKTGDFTGTYENAKQGVRVQVPVTDAATGMFDFVIFSEESLLKNFN